MLFLVTVRSPSITQLTSAALFLVIVASPWMRTPRTIALFLSMCRSPPMTETSGPWPHRMTLLPLIVDVALDVDAVVLAVDHDHRVVVERRRRDRLVAEHRHVPAVGRIAQRRQHLDRAGRGSRRSLASSPHAFCGAAHHAVRLEATVPVDVVYVDTGVTPTARWRCRTPPPSLP